MSVIKPESGCAHQNSPVICMSTSKELFCLILDVTSGGAAERQERQGGQGSHWQGKEAGGRHVCRLLRPRIAKGRGVCRKAARCRCRCRARLLFGLFFLTVVAISGFSLLFLLYFVVLFCFVSHLLPGLQKRNSKSEITWLNIHSLTQSRMLLWKRDNR